MKVICIRSDWYRYQDCENAPVPKYGETYTVINSIIDGDELFYELKGLEGFEYQDFGFIPISSIDETTFERNYNKELA